MGHIGNKFLPGLVQDLHPCEHFVKGVCDQLCLRIIRHRDLFVLIAVGEVLYRLRNSCKRLYENGRQNISQKDRQSHNDAYDKDAALLQFIHDAAHLIKRNGNQHDSLKLLHLRTSHRHSHFHAVSLTDIGIFRLSLETADHDRGDKALPGIRVICVFYHPEIPVDQYHSGPIGITQ